MQRWDDLTPEEQQRYTDNEQLRQQLAAATKRAEDAEARAAKAEATIALLGEYAEARLADPYNDKLTFEYWLQSRK